MTLTTLRRTVQVIVLASLVAVPLVARYAHYLWARQLDRAVENWDGTLPGEVLRLTDRAMRVGIPDGEGGVPTRRPRRAILERAKSLVGSPWSLSAGGHSLTDLLAGAESMVTSVSAVPVLLVGLVLPLLATLLLGRVYCGWICPMRPVFDLALRLRQLAVFLELAPARAGSWAGGKYVVLVTGLLLGFVFGLPLLQAIYPPAIMGREAHLLVNETFDRAERGFLDPALRGLTGASLFLLVLFLVEALLAPGLWCQALCPGGAIYSLLARFRIVRVRRDPVSCTRCTLCDKVCPMGLKPMIDLTGSECDSCGLCVEVCDPRALRFHLATTSAPLAPGPGPGPDQAGAPGVAGGVRAGGAAAAVLLVMLATPGALRAHHILGIPHYAYDESYPQAPVLKLVERFGDWEAQLTAYPGNPRPGERTEMHTYLVNKRTGDRDIGRIRMTIFRQAALGRDVTFGPAAAHRRQNLYVFHPTYPAEANYEVLLEFPDTPARSTLRFPVVVGEPGSPWWIVGSWAGGFLFLLIVLRAIRIKRARRAMGPSANRLRAPVRGPESGRPPGEGSR